ncbi:MAG: ATP-dependent dethiobiotin synthetase BioD [Acidimicrobiales bacterium]
MIVVYCTGTATEVGKTYVGAAVLSSLRRRGCRVSARKPAQSYDPGQTGPTDADVLAAATGEHPDDVCVPGRSYGVAMAPPMAAEVLDRPPVTVGGLLDELRWPDPPPTLGWVEGVGGPRSPVAADGDGVDLCQALDPSLVLLVADAGLGTINAVRLSAEPFRAIGRYPTVFLNRYDEHEELHRRNAEWLGGRDGLTVVTEPEAVAYALGAMVFSSK